MRKVIKILEDDCNDDDENNDDNDSDDDDENNDDNDNNDNNNKNKDGIVILSMLYTRFATYGRLKKAWTWLVFKSSKIIASDIEFDIDSDIDTNLDHEVDSNDCKMITWISNAGRILVGYWSLD